MMKRQLLFGVNLKMHQTPEESVAYFAAAAATPADGARVFVAFPATSLDAVASFARDHASQELWIAAQNMHWEPEGSFTGEISAEMLAAVEVDLVILGHAERRMLFHETDAEINQKVLTALGHGLRVLLCIGESAEDRGFDVSEETLLRQLKIGLHDVPDSAVNLLHVAYEPVWSIGPEGEPAEPEAIAPAAAAIRMALDEHFGAAGQQVPILYGGSVTPENAPEFLATPGIEGLLVGRAAWSIAGFQETLASVISLGSRHDAPLMTGD